MSAMDQILGGKDDPVRCYEQGVVSMHWWAADAQPGDSCLCGKSTKDADEDVAYEERDG